MKRKWLKILLKILVPKKYQYVFIDTVFSAFNTNPLIFAYNRIGILKWQNEKLSGEEDFILNFLIKSFPDRKDTVFFDVGANKGQYSSLLSKFYKNVSIYSFEPLKASFAVAEKNLSKFENITVNNFAFGSQEKKLSIFFDSTDDTSVKASINRSVISDIHKNQKISNELIDIRTIDDYCSKNGIVKIDFLKIDTEGYELEVLKGAAKLIENNGIQTIQFEFNEMNVISRVFLKDFYDILEPYGFNFYRLNEKGMINLKSYNPIHEIFKFQNIIATKLNV
ncbi:FkbM family methyltransferase [Subsaximicrobium wynnwilliamsii]|uniref:FkbM family methyltransferase n=1 Tax=Subsaximicrobium wynnwilliamsii TaxID=291179 RepID=A0A5C6ZEA9_9FLAO|nr:FkbM family methyltransferase [Subsaximicrobium wynnwilliamsii]TXD81701.1 FkbM family methyltransferase [Subsaximicrobium wynnwilliamsii]TXD87456.1 FkbM family methyltransferase [Subsaximicrobium wynnwilliamsii]TXE01144.1 FkbM family methyltransferase [Subsaximicrobium wynnwilliamsii]